MEPMTMASALGLVLLHGAGSKAGSDAWDWIKSRTGEGRTEAIVEASRWDHIIGLLEEIRDSVKDQNIPVGDAAAIFMKSAEARARSADPKKLELIKRATVAAFREEAREHGMQLVYLDLVERLPAPAFEVLARLVGEGRKGNYFKAKRDSSDALFVRMLLEEGLAWAEKPPSEWGRISVVTARPTDPGRGLLEHLGIDPISP